MDRVTYSIRDIHSLEDLEAWIRSLGISVKRWQREWLIRKINEGHTVFIWKELGGFKLKE